MERCQEDGRYAKEDVGCQGEPLSVLQRVLSKSRMRAFQDSGDEEPAFDHANPPYTPPHLEVGPTEKKAKRTPSPDPGLTLKKDVEVLKLSSISNKVKKKRKVKRKSSKGEGLLSDTEVSDSSSVASFCSTTDNSPVKLRKKKKKKRPRCEVHGRSKRRSCDVASILDENLNVTDQNVEGILVCTCSKTSRTRGKRPEPEGRCSIPTLTPSFISEYEKIIYENDPIFSDMEEDPEIDAQIRQESDRHHKKAVERGGADSLFSAAQMLNTNTTIKFAIIQTELKNVIDGALNRVRGDIEKLIVKHLNETEMPNESAGV